MRPCIENLYFETGLHIGHVDIMRHAAWELIFITRGSVHVEIAGKSYDAVAPSMIFISNYEPHVLTVRSESYERYVMLISPSVAKTTLKPAFLQTVFSIHSPRFCHVLPLGEDAALDDLRMLFRNLQAERETDPDDGEGEQIWLSALLWRLYRLSPGLFSSVGGSAEKIVAAIRTELENHPERKLDLNSLAAAHYISSYYRLGEAAFTTACAARLRPTSTATLMRCGQTRPNCGSEMRKTVTSRCFGGRIRCICWRL